MKTTPSLRAPHGRRMLLLSLALAGASSVLAQSFGDSDSAADPRAQGARPPVTLHVEYASTGASPADFRGRSRPDSGAESVSFFLQGMVPVRPPTFMMPLGLAARSIHFDETPDAPVPGSARSISLDTGLGYRPNEAWQFMVRLSPTLYRTADISGDDVGLSGGLIARWRSRPAVTWMFGALANPDGELPVLPVFGATWTISPELTLSLTVPRPQVVYRPNRQWAFHAGASLEGATFRTDRNFGSGRNDPRYNHALASYRDVRVGAGFELRLTPKLGVNAEGGYSVDRRIDYTRIGETVKFGSAPYLQLGLRLTF